MIKYMISESENKIMEFLWDQEDGKYFNEIMTYLNTKYDKNWKNQTVNTFIKRLTDKGLIISKVSKGSNKQYFPAISYNEFKKGEAESMLNQLYQGSVFSFLSALTGGKKIDSEVAESLKKILEEK